MEILQCTCQSRASLGELLHKHAHPFLSISELTPQAHASGGVNSKRATNLR